MMLLCADSWTSARFAALRTSGRCLVEVPRAGAVDCGDDFLRFPPIPSPPGCLNRQSAELGWRSDADFPGRGDVDAVKPEPAELVDRSPSKSVSITLIIHDGAEQTLGSRNVNHGCCERCHAQPALVGGGLEDFKIPFRDVHGERIGLRRSTTRAE
jgi:hypothetical protein